MTDESVQALQGVLAHLGDSLLPIGGSRGVAQVDDVLVGDEVDDCPGHRQATESGVEDADGGSHEFGRCVAASRLGVCTTTYLTGMVRCSPHLGIRHEQSLSPTSRKIFVMFSSQKSTPGWHVSLT